MTEELDRVRAHTDDDVLERLDEERARAVAELVDAPPARIRARLEELDAEWDVERVLELNAAALTLVGVTLSRLVSRRWLLLAGVVPAFLVQHAVQGWCPPLAVLRRLGIRTRREIDAERTAIKALRGDFALTATNVRGDAPATPLLRAREAIAAAGRR